MIQQFFITISNLLNLEPLNNKVQLFFLVIECNIFLKFDHEFARKKLSFKTVSNTCVLKPNPITIPVKLFCKYFAIFK